MTHAVICDYVRTPFHLAHKGALAKTRPDDLGRLLIEALLKRTALNPEDLEDIICGCAFPEAEQGLNVARMMGMIAGLPDTVGGATVNRFCGSSMQAVHQIAGAIEMGAGDAFMALGIESMSRVPMLGYNPLPHPELMQNRPHAYIAMGQAGEHLAKTYDIKRSDQEIFAKNSQDKAAHATAQGYFSDEIIALDHVSTDGCIRPDTRLEALSELAPAFDANGSVTAGTSSPLTDGAAALLICHEDYADQKGLPKLARIKSIAVSGCAPEDMGLGPVRSSQKALKRAGLSQEDLGVVELNEAFAVQALACLDQLKLDPKIVNKDGGAIAIGHPLGATGARLVGKTASLMQRENAKFGLATQCIGGGQGIATVLEHVS